ncbi:Uu.00g035570.m01.CDS01 [Anthostomella pinea]|uniref:chitinase n=1 Tax=Anthostomella pinea TaxID=933095 RepID=A0AAI8V9A0_9PEZI|nr:Uu.00g035570.m01.CDS01 [Anthostomella pinea]
MSPSNIIDIIILSFCSGDKYPSPGYGGKNQPASGQLLKCPSLQRDLYTCRQTSTKKILLSLGGGTNTYQLNGAIDGDAFATMLWYMFGPRQASWVNRGMPRPFDNNNIGFSVDGFDLDIEHTPTDNFAGYKALVTKLRALYASVPGTFYLTASPQCVVPDANMGEILKATTFDKVFVQFYNTPQCAARRWADANAGYAPGGSFDTAGFTFDAWTAFLASTYSRNARLYIGLPGSAAAANPGNDLAVPQVQNLVDTYYCRSNFGGVAIWEATYAAANVVGGKNFNQNVKGALNIASTDSRLSCAAVKTPPQSTTDNVVLDLGRHVGAGAAASGVGAS